MPFARFPQPVFISLQLPGCPFDDLVFGRQAEPSVYDFPHCYDLVGRVGGIGAEHDRAPSARLVHVGKHTGVAIPLLLCRNVACYGL
jgi:hypothetical protein